MTEIDYRQLFECKCHDLRHVMKVAAFEWDEGEDCLSFVLMPDAVTPWQRVKAAWRCLFGVPEALTETLLSAEQARELWQALAACFPVGGKT
jgi:hypothetical protein